MFKQPLPLLIACLVGSFPLTLPAETNVPTLNATFRTELCALPCETQQNINWWLMRSESSVETRQIDQHGKPSKRSGIWSKDKFGNLSYLYLIHDDKRAIDYFDTDLSLLGINRDNEQWEQKTQLITASEIAQLSKKENTQQSAFGKVVEQYEGALKNGTKVKLDWIPSLKVPAKITYTYPTSQSVITLTALADSEKAPITTQAELSKFYRIDYTDLGDIEHNPEDAKWIAKAFQAPGMDHHHH